MSAKNSALELFPEGVPWTVVLGVEDFNALAVMRSLGRMGVPVIAASPDAEAVGFRSRFALRRILHEDSIQDSSDLLSSLEDLAGEPAFRGHPLLLFPTSDRYVRLLSDYRQSLEKLGYIVHLPDSLTINRILEKDEQYREAEIEGIPYPRTWTRKTRKDLHEQLDAGNLQYPLLFKASAVLPDPSLNRSFRRVKLESEESLNRIERASDEANVDYVIQEIIPGGDETLYTFGSTIARDGRVAGVFTGRKLRQSPPGFGVCRVGESLLKPEVEDLGIRLLKRFDFFGVSQVEFKYDKRDGRFKLMEINPRTWFWVSLSTRTGVNLPWLYYLDAFGKKVDRPYQIPKRCLWFSLAADLRHSFTHRDHPPLTYLFSRWYRLKECCFEWNDPIPGILHFRRELIRLFSFCFRRFRPIVSPRQPGRDGAAQG